MSSVSVILDDVKVASTSAPHPSDEVSVVSHKPLAFQDVKLTLDQLPKGAQAVITRIDASPQGSEIALRLMELGFVEGEVVRVVAKGYFAGAPIAVRVGGTTFALRRFEAALISVGRLVQPALTAPTSADESETK